MSRRALWQMSIGLFLALSITSVASARRQYLRDIPSPFGCTTCHGDPTTDPQGPLFRNGFGIDYVFQRQDWSRMCRLDSDGDGLSNAVELLDPQCTWRRTPRGEANTPLPQGMATHPGDANDPNQCGDGEIQGSEECDGSDLGDTTCEHLGYMGGLVTCSETCDVDETDCIPFPTVDSGIAHEDMSTAPADLDMRLPMDLGVDEVSSENEIAGDMTLENDALAPLEVEEMNPAEDFGSSDHASHQADANAPPMDAAEPDELIQVGSPQAPPSNRTDQRGCQQSENLPFSTFLLILVPLSHLMRRSLD